MTAPATGSRSDHPLHPAYIAKNEAATTWFAEKRNEAVPIRVGRDPRRSRQTRVDDMIERAILIALQHSASALLCHVGCRRSSQIRRR
jgi:hypothetical protein